MTGTIKTYAEEKQYGFIKGDDGKDYFFHRSAVDKKDKICEEALVHFEQKVTPKGYSALNIKIDSQIKGIKYIIPDEVYISKERNVKGWDTISLSNWTISGSSRNSPDEAKQIMMQRTANLNINALTNVKYGKTTESEAGTGKGVHYYSVHHFIGVPTNIGRKNLKGTVKKEDLDEIDSYLEKVKVKLEEKTSENLRSLWIIIAVITVIVWGIMLATVKEHMGVFIGLAPFAIASFFVFFSS